jgi:uncharacterized protein (DUF39 family)
MGRKKEFKVQKTYKQINEKIRSGKVVVVTAEEMIDIVEEKGAVAAAKEVDVVTTGTFNTMCSSGAFLNFGHSKPRIRATKVSLNNVPAYAGIAAVDIYLGATEPAEDDPLNKVFPGRFKYGGGLVIQDLVAGKKVHLKAEGYATHCYPNTNFEAEMGLKDFPYSMLFNPRNAYQNYNCAVNVSDETIYTYMGVLRPQLSNANYCSAGQLSPLLNDPMFRTIGMGTHIFLGGGEGYVAYHGTQHNQNPPRTSNGVPRVGAGTLAVTGDLKAMKPEWLVGVSYQGYGCSLAVGIGIPIPILDEEMARFTAVKDKEIYTQVIDYSYDYPNMIANSLGEVNYKQLKSGSVKIKGKKVPTAPLSSYVKAKEIAEILKGRIISGEFLLNEPVFLLPSAVAIDENND